MPPPTQTIREITKAALPLASNYLNLLVMGFATVFLVPIYLRLLGPSEWGILALCLTAHGALLSLDAFVAPLLQRDMSRTASTIERIELWRHYHRRYWQLGLAALGMGLLLLWFVGVESAALERAFGQSNLLVVATLLSLLFVFQFANNATLGTWFGLQLHAKANARTALFLVLKHAFALVAIYSYQAEAWTYLAAFVTIAAIEYSANRIAIQPIMKQMSDARTSVFPSAKAPHNSQTLTWYWFATALALCSAQLDRLVLSTQLNSIDYGKYFLISSVWLSVLSLLPPIQRHYLSQIAQSSSTWSPLRSMWRASLAVVVLPCALMIVFAESVLAWWLGDAAIARLGAPALQIGLLGVVGIALYAPIGNWLFVQYRYRAILILNAVIFAVQILLLTMLVPSIGMRAGAWAWMAWGGIQTVFALLLWFGLRTQTRGEG